MTFHSGGNPLLLAESSLGESTNVIHHRVQYNFNQHTPLNSLPPTTTSPPTVGPNPAGLYLQLTEQQLSPVLSARLCLGLDDIFIALFLILLILLTVFGNVLVVLSVCLYKRMRTFTNILLTSLATAGLFESRFGAHHSLDLLVGLVVMPLALVDLLYSHHWPFGRLLCGIWATTDVLLCTASILNLCVISLDRYMAITSPLKYPRTRSRLMAVVLLSSVWFISLIVCSPPWFVPGWGLFTQAASKTSNNDFVCVYSPSIPYRIYSASVSFYIPLMIMLSVYFKIFKVASAREKLMRQTLGTCRLSRRIDKTRKRQNLLHSNSYYNRCASAPTSRTQETQVLNFNDVMSTRHNNSLHCSESGLDTSINDKRSSSLVTEQNEDMSDMESPVRLVTNNNSHHNNDNLSKLLSTVESKSLVNLSTNDRKKPTPRRKVTETTDLQDLAQRSTIFIQNNGKQQPTHLVAKAQQHYHKHGPGKAIRGSKEKIVYMRERKALKTIGIVVLGFIICWMPFFVIYLIEVFWTINTYSFRLLGEFFLWLGYSNSCLNPIIYTLYNGDFRRCFRDLLGFGCLQHHRRTMSVKKLHQQSTVF